MQQVTLNIQDSISDKFFWLLSHFDKNEIEVVEFDEALEDAIQQGLDSPISSLSHQEIFQNLRNKHASK